MESQAITLPLALAMTVGTALLTIGGAWAVMRTRVSDIRESHRQQAEDLREAFRRIATLERESVTRENLTEFRKEILTELHSIRDLIERIRTPRPRNSQE